jgi:hypothetical protein
MRGPACHKPQFLHIRHNIEDDSARSSVECCKQLNNAWAYWRSLHVQIVRKPSAQTLSSCCQPPVNQFAICRCVIGTREFPKDCDHTQSTVDHDILDLQLGWELRAAYSIASNRQ